MVVVVSGMHLFNRCEGAAVAARGAAHTRVCREFCPLASTQGAAAGAVVRVRRAAIGRFVDSVMAACEACVELPKWNRKILWASVL